MCSDAVVHLIDAPLFVGYTYANGTKVNMRPWREVVKEYLNN
jgi:GTP-binding protein EngB required for normal cell division